MSRQKVKNVMSTDVATVHEGAPVKDVVRTLALRDVSAVPVVNRDGRVVGVVSEADLLIKQGTQEIEWSRSLRTWWRARRDLRRTTATVAGQLMTRPAVTVSATATVAGAARLMTEHNVKRLPVVDKDGRLVGIVSRKDVLAVFLRKDEDIRDEIVEYVLGRGLDITPNRATVTVDVHDGEVVLTGQLDLRSQLSLVEELTHQVDGVVDVTTSLTYRQDDTRGRAPGDVTFDFTQPPRVR
jgi:CBS domain-containing protein